MKLTEIECDCIITNRTWSLLVRMSVLYAMSIFKKVSVVLGSLFAIVCVNKCSI